MVEIDYTQKIPNSVWIVVNKTIQEKTNLKKAYKERFNVGGGSSTSPIPRIYPSYDEAKIAANKYKWGNVEIVQFVQPK